MAKTGKIKEIDSENLSIKFEKSENWIKVGKKVFNKENFKIGEVIEYEIKGANFDFKRKIDAEVVYNTKNNNSGNRFGNSQAKSNLSKPTVKEMYYPYNFVSLGNLETIKKEREKGRSEEYKNSQRYSGKLVCTLTNLTPIFTSDSENLEYFYKENNRYIIPASSIKGEIRNIIDTITSSCIKTEFEENVPKEFHKCFEKDELCFSCRLFGTTGNDNKKVQNNNIPTSIGKLFFTDLEVVGNHKTKSMILKPLGSPGVDEEKKLNKYYLKDNLIRGRKFYWHHTNMFNSSKFDKIMDSQKKKTNCTINYLESNKIFKFQIHFKNLTDEELGVLIYALELEKDLLHKVGKAKALGFGSSKIEIKEFLLDSEEKYSNFFQPYLKNVDKNKFLKIAEKNYLNERNKELNELKKILNKNKHDFSQGAYIKRDFKKLPTIEEYYK